MRALTGSRRVRTGHGRGWAFLVVVSVVAVTICACSAPAPSERDVPIGDPISASRPISPSATLRPADDIRPVDPGQLHIPAISVNSNILSLGTTMAADPFLANRQVTTFEVPPDLSQVGWWRDGASLGGRGMAVILGHSQVGGRYAVFNQLDQLEPADIVGIEDRSGRVRVDFAVTEVVKDIPKSDETALQTLLSQHSGSSQLALITCGGLFDTNVSESVNNTVVFARRR